jgi:undecaprenyl-diphosphatase
MLKLLKYNFKKVYIGYKMLYLIIIIFLQIILESLPVSSSGHLLLAEKILHAQIPKHFDYFLHGSTIIILLIIFYKEWIEPVRYLITGIANNFFRKKASYKNLLNIFFKIITLVIISNSITTLIWFIFKFYLEESNWFGSNLHLLIGFCITTLFLFLLKFKENNICKCKININIYIKYIILGLIQGMALFPGISRFASTYTVSRFLNFTPKRAFQITFLLELPLIFAGFLLGIYHVNKISNTLSLTIWLAIITATIISGFIFKFVKKLSQSNNLHKFSYYMIIPIVILIYIILR